MIKEGPAAAHVDPEGQALEVAERLRRYARSELPSGSLVKALKDATGGTSWRECLEILAQCIDGRDE